MADPSNPAAPDEPSAGEGLSPASRRRAAAIALATAAAAVLVAQTIELVINRVVHADAAEPTWIAGGPQGVGGWSDDRTVAAIGAAP
jgi:hypothetical protein